MLCELYAKLIGVLLQHWLMVRLAWQDAQRSLVKLAQVLRGEQDALAMFSDVSTVVMSSPLRASAAARPTPSRRAARA